MQKICQKVIAEKLFNVMMKPTTLTVNMMGVTVVVIMLILLGAHNVCAWILPIRLQQSQQHHNIPFTLNNYSAINF